MGASEHTEKIDAQVERIHSIIAHGLEQGQAFDRSDLHASVLGSVMVARAHGAPETWPQHFSETVHTLGVTENIPQLTTRASRYLLRTACASVAPPGTYEDEALLELLVTQCEARHPSDCASV